MTNDQLNAIVAEAKAQTKAALETIYNALNQGQRKQIAKDDKVKTLFDLYGVEYSE